MIGVITHEQGHAFGLPHAADRPEGCTGGPSVMDVWWDYDRGATLCEEDARRPRDLRLLPLSPGCQLSAISSQPAVEISGLMADG